MCLCRISAAVGRPKLGADHQVTFVGYGVKDGKNVWLVKNSWGDLGNEGYFYVIRGSNEYCLEEYAYALIPDQYSSSSGVFNHIVNPFPSAFFIERGNDGFDIDDGSFVNLYNMTDNAEDDPSFFEKTKIFS